MKNMNNHKKIKDMANVLTGKSVKSVIQVSC